VPLTAVPADDAPLQEVMQFATMSYFGYDRHGGVEGLAAVANPALDAWRELQQFPESENAVRASLFFESRRWHHSGYPPDDEAEAYMRALVSQLRTLAGDSVKADRDGLSWRIRRRSRRSD
jgi:hypothetical protein